MAKKKLTKGGTAVVRTSFDLDSLKKSLEGMLTSGGRSLRSAYETYSTGFIPLDLTLGTGGWLQGKIYEIYGEEHTGKTYLCMASCAEQGRRYKQKCLWADIEDLAFDERWYDKLGGKLSYLDIFRPDPSKMAGEEAMESFLDLIGTGEYKIAVLDSLQGPLFLPKRLLEKKLWDTKQPGIRAVVNNEFFEKAALLCTQTKTTLLVTNHLSVKIGVVFGNPETTAGGKTLKYLADGRLRISKTSKESVIKGTIIKQKRAPVRGHQFDIVTSFDSPYDNSSELITLCIKEGVVDQVKSKLYFGKHVWESKSSCVEGVKASSSLYDSLKKSLLEVRVKGFEEMDYEDIEDFEELE